MSQIYVIIGCSGSGKTELAKRLKENSSFETTRVITDTTREKRQCEENGLDYYFKTKEEFEKGIAQGEYLEYVIYDGHYKGLRKKELEKVLNKGNSNILLIMDINGARTIKKEFPMNTTTVFITVPKEILEDRMRKRGDTEESIRRRVELYFEENKNSSECDYILTNTSTLEELENKFLELVVCA